MKKLHATLALASILALWPARAGAQNILVFDASTRYQVARTALTNLGYSFTTSDTTDFVTQLTSGTAWDLVIIDMPSSRPSGSWETEVSTFITAGGSVIGSCWYNSSIDALAPAFEFTRTGNHDAVAMYGWDTTHPLLTVLNAIPDITSGITDYFGTNGPYMTGLSGTTEVAGSTTTPTLGQAMIVVGSSGRTIFNGFLFDDYGMADNDSDGDYDGVELLENEILFLLDIDSDRDGDGWTIRAGDCNDWDDTIHPGVTTDFCDGADNDCDPSTPDGSSESWYGTPCDGTDADLCLDGIEACIGSARGCDDDLASIPDVCDGADNDCNPSTPDGAGDTRVGSPCDGGDTDLCTEGTGTCVSGAFVCTDDTGDTLDTCEGTDDDCDPSTPDGSHETWYGDACDGVDPDLCELGFEDCISGSRACNEDPAGIPDVCDGDDNDCDPSTPDGHGDDLVDEPCDGDDPDFCAEGIWSCVSGALSCSDTMEDTPDLCDGIDNDCDSTSEDGVDEDWFLAPCDGTDGDLCEEGVFECISGTQVCNDRSENILDICNVADDDCDPASVDGEDEDWFEDPCDGPDADLCAEGTFSCVDGIQTCDDFTDDNAEVCNGVDDDCNPATSEMADNDGDGVSACDGDCDDGDPLTYPGAEEICGDGIDQDCDPTTDHDGDGDGYYDCDGDCAPMNPNINPGVDEDCSDGADNDCDGLADDLDPDCMGIGGHEGCGCVLLPSTGGGGAVGLLILLVLTGLGVLRRRS